MFNKTTLALTAALVLGTAPGAFAANKHHAAPKAPVQTNVSTASSAYGSDNNPAKFSRDTYMLIQDRDWSNQTMNPYCGGRC